ncbi:MAG TPA: asparagine synthase-related protein, partial [Bacteroidia bacterium]|nr:asparagine synthase-related protein [Bacteroidia bacterium]
ITHKHIPASIMERDKMGFNIPYERWFQNELKDYMLDELSIPKIKSQAVLNDKKISEMITYFYKGKNTDFQRLWAVLNFQLWFDRWMT